MHPRFNGENLERNKLLYSRFADLAAKHACTPPQLALAWLLHQGDDIIPIPGMLGSYILLNYYLNMFGFPFLCSVKQDKSKMPCPVYLYRKRNMIFCCHLCLKYTLF